MKSLFSITLITLFALISFNSQNYKLLTKIKTTVTISECETFKLEDNENVKITFSQITRIVLASFDEESEDNSSHEFFHSEPSLINQTINQLYHAQAPPFLA